MTATAGTTHLDYYLRDGVAERITCPTLVCAAADDLFFETHIYDWLDDTLGS